MKRTEMAASIFILLASSLTTIFAAGIPRIITYQGRLTDNAGAAVVDSDYTMIFTIYDAAADGNDLWSSGEQLVTVAGGLFTYELGSVAGLFSDVFDDSVTWLGIKVGSDPEIQPRTRLTSAAYSYRSLNSDLAEYALRAAGWTDNDGSVVLETSTDSVGIGTTSPSEKLEVDGSIRVTGKANIGPGNTNSGPDAFVAGNDNIASGWYSTVTGGSQNRAGEKFTVVSGGYKNNASSDRSSVGGGDSDTAAAPYSGVFSGYSNLAGDEEVDTAAYVGGGFENAALGRHSVVCGGRENEASGNHSAIGGGMLNRAEGSRSAVAGGQENRAAGYYSVVGGGSKNSAGGLYSTIPGGYGDTITGSGDYSYLFGIGSKLSEDSTFLVDMPHIRFGTDTTGYEFPYFDGNPGQVMSTDGMGQLSWTDMSGGTSRWTLSGSLLHTNDLWGLTRGNAANSLQGDSAFTAVNLGVACTTMTYPYLTIGGGYGNDAAAYGGTIAGGSNNLETEPGGCWVTGLDGGHAAIGGGQWNVAEGHYSTVSGGSFNVASYVGTSTIPGEEGGWSTVSGGRENNASGDYSTVGGGRNNTAAFGSATATIGGYSTVSGGERNYAFEQHSTVGGGLSDSCMSLYATVGGGYRNTAGVFIAGFPDSGIAATVAGGRDNWANGAYSTVGGGFDNRAFAVSATIAGGEQNEAGFAASVGGGDGNDANSSYSAIMGGRDNRTDGIYSAILGGYSNHILYSADYSFLFGINSSLSEDSTLMVDMPHIHFGDADSGYEIPSKDGYSNQMLVTNGTGIVSWGNPTGWTDWGTTIVQRDTTDNVGVGTAFPQYKLDVRGVIRNAYKHTYDQLGSVHVQNFNGSYAITPGNATRGVWAGVSSDDDEDKVAVSGYAIGGGGNQIGVYGGALGYGDTLIGVYAYATSPSSHPSVGLMTMGDEYAIYSYWGDIYFGGDVGIGTDTPSEELHVVGDICYTGSCGACSDARYKRDVNTISSALEKVSGLRGVTYRWKKETFPGLKFDDNTHMGFLAQEVKELLPDLVLEDDEGFYSIDYSRITPLLVEAIKELKAENEQLRDEVSEVDELKSEMVNLKRLFDQYISTQ